MNTRFAQFKLVLLGTLSTSGNEPRPTRVLPSHPHFADYCLQESLPWERYCYAP
jgi:hypothetical protein